jgi:hypothetical protein
MTNFLEETIDDIKSSGHAIEDVVFIGSLESGFACRDWAHFAELANFEYDSGFGSQKIATDLIISFSDKSHMWRHEYDGSESWHYTKPIELPTETKETKILGGDNYMWKSLEEMNEGDEDGYRKD